jgi:hypothetical protein
VHISSAFADLPGTPAVDDRNPESDLEEPYNGSSSWFEPSSYLPLRAPGERDIRATKIERLRLIGDLSARLAMAFVAICLAAMILSTLLQRK